MMVEAGRITSLLTAVKGLTISNVLVIFLLVVIAVPAYTVWRALGDDRLLDRFLSTYKESYVQNVPCVLRQTQVRGGPQRWGISSGFAVMGADRWFVSVVIDHEPTVEEMMSHCETLKLLADTLGADHPADVGQRGGTSEVQRRPMPGVTPSGN